MIDERDLPDAVLSRCHGVTKGRPLAMYRRSILFSYLSLFSWFLFWPLDTMVERANI